MTTVLVLSSFFCVIFPILVLTQYKIVILTNNLFSTSKELTTMEIRSCVSVYLIFQQANNWKNDIKESRFFIFLNTDEISRGAGCYLIVHGIS